MHSVVQNRQIAAGQRTPSKHHDGIRVFKALDFKVPNQKTEDLYIASVNETLDNYRRLLAQAGKNKLELTDTDFDTGRPTHAGEYMLTDKTYAHLLDQLAKDNFKEVTPDLKQNILAFYGDPAAPNAIKRKPSEWQKTEDEVQRLREVVASNAPSIQLSDSK